MTAELRSFLELNLPKVKEGKKPKFSLGTSEPKLGSHMLEATKIPCRSNEFVLELLRAWGSGKVFSLTSSKDKGAESDSLTSSKDKGTESDAEFFSQMMMLRNGFVMGRTTDSLDHFHNLRLDVDSMSYEGELVSIIWIILNRTRTSHSNVNRDGNEVYSVNALNFHPDFDEAILYQRTNLISATQGRRCPKLTGVGASTVFTRYCWEYFNLPIEPIPLQLDCKASELHCFPHLGTDQRPPQSNLEVLVKFCTNFSPVQLYDVGAEAVKKSNVSGVKITFVDHGTCVGDEAVEGGLADATAPGHNSVN
uniref:Uncharacterized protein n=1 Tax=Brassica campestris TaxID=3711 RepID=M4F8G1_BRACM